MEYLIVGLLIILIIAVIILIVKVNKNTNNDLAVTEKLGTFQNGLTKEIGDFKYEFSNNLKKDFEALNDRIEQRMIAINEKVNTRLDENFEKSNKTFANVLERLSRIDEAQKKIDSLSTEIVSLQSVLTDKKTRGIYGEVNLNYILTSVFGEKNNRLYEIQYKLSNGFIADSVIHAPEPLGNVCIDSKFPLENYERMTNKSLSKEEREMATKMFKIDVKKHLEAISSKYIIPGETSNQAIMFLPAEAIFAELNAYHPDLLKEAYKHCIDNLDLLENDTMLKKYIIPKIDFNSLNDKIIENLSSLPFQNEEYIIALFSDGIAKDSTTKQYFEIKKMYQKYINMKITFFDINEHQDTDEHVELYNLLNTDEKLLRNMLNNIIVRGWEQNE